MEIESIIFTLFMVSILLTISVADNITGRAIDISSASTSGCKTMCVKDIPICGKGKICISDLKIIIDNIPTSVPSYTPKPVVSQPQALTYVTKECDGICDPYNHPDSPDWLIYSSKKEGDKCVIDYSIPPVNCKYSDVKNSECVEGICKWTIRAENYAKAAAETEGDIIV